jgi:hypothetical protein
VFILRGGPIPHGFLLLRFCGSLSRLYSTPRVPHFLLKEFARLWIEIQAGISEPLEYFLQVEQVLLERAANHDHVPQVQET